MYIDCPKEMIEMITKWVVESTPNITVGRSIQSILKGINEHTGMILINPWDHIDKDENAGLESESNFLIGSIREYLEQYPGMCFIFGGSGEMG